MANSFIGIIAPGIIIVPIAIASFKIRYWGSSEKLFLCYLLFCGGFNLIAKLTAHRNNLPLLHLYTILEFCVLCICFRSLFAGKRIRSLLTALIVIFPVFAVSYVFITQTLFRYNAAPRFAGSIILTLLCTLFLIEDLSRDLHSGQTASKFSFTAVVGLLIYYSSCSALFGLSNYLMYRNHDMSVDTLIWNLHAVFMALMYLIFAGAYATLKKQ